MWIFDLDSDDRSIEGSKMELHSTRASTKVQNLIIKRCLED